MQFMCCNFHALFIFVLPSSPSLSTPSLLFSTLPTPPPYTSLPLIINPSLPPFLPSLPSSSLPPSSLPPPSIPPSSSLYPFPPYPSFSSPPPPIQTELEVSVEEVHHPGSVLDFPHRPPWSYDMSKAELVSLEERQFEAYLKDIYSKYTAEQLSYFEHNLEVTEGAGNPLPSPLPSYICYFGIKSVFFPLKINESLRHKFNGLLSFPTSLVQGKGLLYTDYHLFTHIIVNLP